MEQISRLDDMYASFQERNDLIVTAQKGFNLAMIIGESFSQLKKDIMKSTTYDGGCYFKSEWLPLIQFGLEWTEWCSVAKLYKELPLKQRTAAFLKNGTKNQEAHLMSRDEVGVLLQLLRNFQQYFNGIEYQNGVTADERSAPYNMREGLENRDGIEYVSELLYTRYPIRSLDEFTDKDYISVPADYILFQSYLMHVSNVYEENIGLNRRDKETYNKRKRILKEENKTYLIMVEKTKRFKTCIQYMTEKLSPELYGNKVGE